MAGAGVLALAHAGIRDERKLQEVGDWILNHGFGKYNSSGTASSDSGHTDRYHYSLFNCGCKVSSG